MLYYLTLMVRGILLTILGAFSAAAQTAVLATPSVAIFLGFDSAPTRVSLESMKAEVARLMKPTGFKLHWRSLKQNTGAEWFSSVVVLNFHGTCKLEYTPDDGDQPDGEVTLATTQVNDGRVLPYSDIACDQVVRVLANSIGNRQKALGTALGRVVAHELFHFFAGATRHAGRGLAKRAHSAIDLTAGALRFNEAEMRAILKGHSVAATR